MAGEPPHAETRERDLFARGGFGVPSATPHLAPGFTPAEAPVVRADAALASARRTGKARDTLPGGRVAPAATTVRDAVADAFTLEIERGTPFILAPTFMAIGALGYFCLPWEPGALPLGAGLVLLMPLVLSLRGHPLLFYPVAALLLILAGAAAGKLETWRAGTPMLGGEITTSLTGRIVELETMATGRVRLTLDVIATARPVLRYAPERVRVSARRVPEGSAPGAVLVGLVRLLPPSGPVRPGSYDFSFESYFDRIGASGFFLRDPIGAEPLQPAPLRTRFDASVEAMRTALADRIRSAIGEPEGEIAAALIVGVRAGIPEPLNDTLRRAGIYHVISISGLHMALVASTIMVMLRLGFGLFPDFASRFAVKKLAAALALAGLTGYLFLSGAEVAARRSYIMIAVMLVAVLFDRAALTMRNLAISAFIVILLSPHEVVGPSFQMSFAATAALVGAYALWSDKRQGQAAAMAPGSGPVRWIARRIGLGFAGLAVTSVVAGAATAIYAAYHFQQMPSLGLFTNLTVMPVVSIVVMPSAVMAMLTMPLGLDAPFLILMGKGLALSVAIARWFAERSPLDMVGLLAPSGVLVMTAALVIASAATTWLRALALPAAAAGSLLLWPDLTPHVLVSEDGRLVAIDAGEGRIAVNRARPNAFTMQNWQRSFGASAVIAPATTGGRGTSEGPVASNGQGFSCSGSGACRGDVNAGDLAAEVVVAPDGRSAAGHCSAALVVVVDPGARGVCPQGPARIITSRDLALRGTAAVHFVVGSGGAVQATITHAIPAIYRPWHEHRRFSRAARGLPPYQPKRAAVPRPAEAGVTQGRDNGADGAQEPLDGGPPVPLP